MSDSIYYCKRENNTCPKKESCKRYMEAEGNNIVTLFKASCAQDNNYILYIKYEVEDVQK